MQRVTFKPSHFNTPRRNASRVVILLSDGEQNTDCLNMDCQAIAIAAATPLKDGGATVFSWGFGDISMDTLEGIASSATRDHVPYTLHMHMHCHPHPHLHPEPHPEPPTLTPNLTSHLHTCHPQPSAPTHTLSPHPHPTPTFT